MPNFGEEFLHQKDTKLHTSGSIEHEKKRQEVKGEKTSQKPADKIADWLKVIEQTHTSHRDNPRVLERIKASYHKEYVIDEEDIPESYFDNQTRLAREEGRENIEIGEEQKTELKQILIRDQKTTLNKWTEYFSSEDSESYPTWAKYWSFTNMIKLSSYDKEKHSFSKRSKDTVAPFPDLNREALAYVVDAVIKKKVGKENLEDTIEDEDLRKLLGGANFAKLYAHAIEKITPTEENELINTEGEWVKYDQGSDYMPLVNSLQGHGTNWCTAGEATAEAQLSKGDFYIYYSNDKEGNPTIPRSAIRMEGDSIAEVRGIVGKDQNLDPYIGNVLDKKLDDFPDKEKYQKKSTDMKQLTDIDNRHKAEEELTKEDLRFLYEIDERIEGFGYDEDPRIKEIKEDRNIKTDISLLTGYSEDEISITYNEALSGGIKFNHGSLYLDHLYSTEGLKLPEIVGGDLDLYNLTSAEGLKLPKIVNGYLVLANLRSAEGLKLPKIVNGDINLNRLASAKGLELPDNIRGNLYLRSLTSAEKDELRKKYPNLNIK